MRLRKLKKRWFWVWLVQATVAKGDAAKPSARCEVWKNLIIVKAKDADEAYEMATAVGASEQGDCRGTLRLYGKPAVAKFLGIEDMGLIHDDLMTGAEILWRIQHATLSRARSLVKPKRNLIRRVKKESGS